MIDDKLFYTILSTIVFVIFNNPYTYRLMNMMIGHIVKVSTFDGCPTTNGLIIATFLFAIAIFLVMVFDDFVNRMKYNIRDWFGIIVGTRGKMTEEVIGVVVEDDIPVDDSNTEIPDVKLKEDIELPDILETAIPPIKDDEAINVKEGFSPF